MSKIVKSHWELEVYKKAFDVACALTESSKTFPREETYSLTDQMRRACRSVCANFAEGWRKRCYEAAFIAKLVDSEGEAAETQVWIQFAVKCGYLTPATGELHFRACDEIIRMLVAMRLRAQEWILPQANQKRISKG
jgi:four helix bundle protein